MFIDFLLAIFREHARDEAIVWNNKSVTYQELTQCIEKVRATLASHSVHKGMVVAVRADYSPLSVATLLTLIDLEAIAVPLTGYVESKIGELLSLSEYESLITIAADDSLAISRSVQKASHPLYQELRIRKHPGLVLFSSGSTGVMKGAVHDFAKLLEKFKTRRHNLRTLTFLLLDHIGGIDTLLYSLSNGSCIVTIRDRSPDAVCAAISKWKVEVLPVTPTFLNLLLLSHAYERHNLSSLKYITYGTEVMAESTLRQVAKVFPQVKLLQKYGTTETGTLRSKSRNDGTTWVKVGGEGIQTRVVNGMFEIKAESAMLGYLNAPSPFTPDGWFMTGDLVEQSGEYIKFLGRKTDVINVGGEKVYPAEVENVIQQVNNVAEVSVYGEKNPLTGNIVCARVKPVIAQDTKEFVQTIKAYCRERLELYKIPVKVTIVEESQHSERFKKIRPKLS